MEEKKQREIDREKEAKGRDRRPKIEGESQSGRGGTDIGENQRRRDREKEAKGRQRGDTWGRHLGGETKGKRQRGT
jgi:hypothetical protein